jgi:riboflavin kinase/FMN adenylyltransferase
MELVRGLHNVDRTARGCALTIGAFDGIHRGHQEMIRVLRSLAAKHSLPAALLSFEPTPREFFAKGAPPARLTRFREKYEALRHYGRNMAGNVETLRAAGAAAGFFVTEVPPFEIDGERVSSSLIRAALDAGDMARAARLLGRPYRMSGKVVEGARLGRKLGFPTANLRPQRRATPLAGVFAIRVSGGGLHNAPGVASLGTRPAVNGKELLLEAHVFDFDGDLYRKSLHVDFIARLRDELDFPDVGRLVEQMKRDAARAREILSRSV